MIIAKRILKYLNDNDRIDDIIYIFLPEFDGKSWICNYEIQWPENQRISSGSGIDSVQALHLTLQKIGLAIYMSNYHTSGRLFWEEPGSGYGFPVPKNGRDFLIDQDKEFDG